MSEAAHLNFDLTAVERDFVNKVRLTGEFILHDGCLPAGIDEALRIRAKVIRHLLLNHRFVIDDGNQGDTTSRLSRLILKGACIVGRLDLRDVRPIDGQPPLAIAIENCRFIQDFSVLNREDCEQRDEVDINLDHAIVGRLSLKGSRFRCFQARHARFSGSVDVSEVMSSEEEGSDCTGCQPTDLIDGSSQPASSPQHEQDQTIGASKELASADTVSLDVSSGTALAVPEQNDVSAGPAVYETSVAIPLNLPRCEIDIADSRIDGQFKAERARLAVKMREAGEKRGKRDYLPRALNMQGVRLVGDALMSELEAQGGIGMIGADVDGSIWLDGAFLRNVWEESSLNLQSARVKGSLVPRAKFLPDATRPFISIGTLRLYGTTIDGEVFAAGCVLLSPQGIVEDKFDDYALMSYNARIGQTIRFIPSLDDETGRSVDFICGSNIVVQNIDVGALILDCTRSSKSYIPQLFGRSDISKIKMTALDIVGVRFNNDVSINGGEQFLGWIIANGSRVRGNFVVEKAKLHGVELENIEIEGELKLDDVEIENGFYLEKGRIKAHVNLRGARVGRRAQLKQIKCPAGAIAATALRSGSDMLFEGTSCAQLDAKRMQVGGNLKLEMLTVPYGLDISDSLVGGNALLAGIDVPAPPYVEADVVTSGLRVTGSLRFEAVDSRASLFAEQLELGRDLVFEDVKLSESSFRHAPRISVQGSNIDGNLELIGNNDTSTRKYGISYDTRVPVSELPRCARSIDLSFYPGWKLVEAQPAGDEYIGSVASWLWNGEDRLKANQSTPNLMLLDGTSPPIHWLNARAAELDASEKRGQQKADRSHRLSRTEPRLTLTSDKRVRDYLQFFCAHVWGDDGAFEIVIRKSEFEAMLGEAQHETTEQELEALIDRLNLRIQRADDGSFELKAIVRYGNQLFKADFRVQTNGMIEMSDDEQIADKLPPGFHYTKPLRRALLREPVAVKQLADLATLGESDWAMLSDSAGELVDAAVRKVHREIKLEEKYWLRSRPLNFYPGWRLVQTCHSMFDQSDEKKKVIVLSWLWDGEEEIIALNGLSQPIRRLNAGERSPLRLLGADGKPDEELCRSYLKFFCAHVWAEDGAFNFLHTAGALPANTETRYRLAGLSVYGPGHFVHVEGQARISDVPIGYAGQVFKSRFRIQTGAIPGEKAGLVEMLDDDPLEAATYSSLLAYTQPFIALAKAEATDNLPQFDSFVVGEDGFVVSSCFHGRWSDLSRVEKRRFYEALEHDALSRCQLDLSSVRARELKDGYGDYLGRFLRLNLSGLRVDLIDSDEIVDPPVQASDQQVKKKDLKDKFGHDSAAPQVPIVRQDQSGASSENRADDGQPRAIRQPNKGRDVKKRISWLKRDAVTDYGSAFRRLRDPRCSEEFDAHPYEEISRLYAASGRTHEVRDILRSRLERETLFRSKEWVRSFGRPVWAGGLVAFLALLWGAVSVSSHDAWAAIVWSILVGIAIVYGPSLVRLAFKTFFDYGLSTWRALATMTALLVLGWFGVEAGNKGTVGFSGLKIGEFVLAEETTLLDFRGWRQVLVMAQVPVQYAVTADGQGNLKPAVQEVAAASAADEIPCGDAINGFVYAVDTFLPLVDLHQESQCRPSGKKELWFWHHLKAMYSILGWIVISLTILTVTGQLRRQNEK